MGHRGRHCREASPWAASLLHAQRLGERGRGHGPPKRLVRAWLGPPPALAAPASRQAAAAEAGSAALPPRALQLHTARSTPQHAALPAIATTHSIRQQPYVHETGPALRRACLRRAVSTARMAAAALWCRSNHASRSSSGPRDLQREAQRKGHASRVITTASDSVARQRDCLPLW